ncbi:phosphoheptose isomerase [Paenibacillus pectinilyticus]|uniref:Phosphoheptose isomerase n=1 Tax=Paenibacillus pectinilyticus TaxID=512399 RepID=A0A1C0ZVC7_9BACL|nr:SIS domain-containing protein [Paenibacillus pectinilyticus]OCT12061.1 phosphoheptose isomerase [Paenibacillus pectinilyticus]
MDKHVLENYMHQLVERYPELEACTSDIRKAFQLCADTYHLSGKILLCGNGGSASDCDHIVGELMKGFLSKRPVSLSFRDTLVEQWDHKVGTYLADHLQQALPAISLTNHSALITAFANDVEPEMIFAQQVYGYGQKGDVLMVLTTSGNSTNVLRAVQTARALGMHTIGLTGKHGGHVKALCDVTITVPWERTPDIQERHLPIYHILCTMLEKEFFG